MNRKELYKEVALRMIQTRALGVIKGSEKGSLVDPQFLEDVALITEAIMKGSEQFDQEQLEKNRKNLIS